MTKGIMSAAPADVLLAWPPPHTLPLPSSRQGAYRLHCPVLPLYCPCIAGKTPNHLYCPCTSHVLPILPLYYSCTAPDASQARSPSACTAPAPSLYRPAGKTPDYPAPPLPLTAGKTPDYLYCLELLLGAGIVVVPGSGFGQEAGTYHFRTTFLPSEEDIGYVVDKIAAFHKSFLAKYGGLSSGAGNGAGGLSNGCGKQ